MLSSWVSDADKPITTRSPLPPPICFRHPEPRRGRLLAVEHASNTGNVGECSVLHKSPPDVNARQRRLRTFGRVEHTSPDPCSHLHIGMFGAGRSLLPRNLHTNGHNDTVRAIKSRRGASVKENFLVHPMRRYVVEIACTNSQASPQWRALSRG